MAEPAAALSAEEMKREWRCFHCDEVFTDKEAAADHFGVQIDGLADDCACKLNAKDGLILKMLREAQVDLRRYHEEDTALIREVYKLGGDHVTNARQQEELGYARGLRDAKHEVDRAEAAEQRASALAAQLAEAEKREWRDAAELTNLTQAKTALAARLAEVEAALRTAKYYLKNDKKAALQVIDAALAQPEGKRP